MAQQWEFVNMEREKFPISTSIEDYVRNWTGYKGCACKEAWVCPICDLKQLVERLHDN